MIFFRYGEFFLRISIVQALDIQNADFSLVSEDMEVILTPVFSPQKTYEYPRTS